MATSTTATGPGHIGKLPDITQADCPSNRSQDKSCVGGPLFAHGCLGHIYSDVCLDCRIVVLNS